MRAPMLCGDFYLGDCFDIMRGIPDGSVDMVLCDLPYGTTRNQWDSALPLAALWAEYWRITKSPNYSTRAIPKAKVNASGDRFPRDVLRLGYDVALDGPRSGRHPTQKPVALFEYMIRTYTRPGEVVLDNCAGSGTTAIAAARAGRRYICIERDEAYFAGSLARAAEAGA